MSADVPPLADPSWSARAAPLLAYLREPRSWAAIESWCRSRDRSAGVVERMSVGTATHCLAWAEDRGLARSFVHDGAVLWLARAHMTEPVVP